MSEDNQRIYNDVANMLGIPKVTETPLTQKEMDDIYMSNFRIIMSELNILKSECNTIRARECMSYDKVIKRQMITSICWAIAWTLVAIKIWWF